jgi:hypothetical protein
MIANGRSWAALALAMLLVGALLGWWLTRPSYSEITVVNGVSYFRGTRCSKDCSGHKAGYDWAKQQEIDELDHCRGKSESFAEGCRIYVMRQWEAQMEADRAEAAGR